MPGAYDRSRNAAVVREISANFEAAVSSFFGTRTPNREAAQGAHDAYVAALRAHGTDVTVLPGLDEHPDCCFVEDTAVMVDGKAIIPNMGHPPPPLWVHMLKPPPRSTGSSHEMDTLHLHCKPWPPEQNDTSTRPQTAEFRNCWVGSTWQGSVD